MEEDRCDQFSKLYTQNSRLVPLCPSWSLWLESTKLVFIRVYLWLPFPRSCSVRR